MPGNPYRRNMINDMLFVAVRPMVGCSLEVGENAHVRSFFLGFVSEKADYTRPNFFSEKIWTPDDSVGIFPFWVVKRVGKGCISVCTDSTVFSNFALFQPKVLSLIRGLFQWDYVFGLITDLFPYFLVSFLLFLFLASFSKRALPFVYFLLFLSLLIPTKSYVLFSRNVDEFYPSQDICYIDSKNEFIYEPEQPGKLSWRFSVSNLLSNLPRYKIYPYYVDTVEKIFGSRKMDLIVTEYDYEEYITNSKRLIVNRNENENPNASEKVLYSNPNFSDFYLGTWWTSLEISPFRKAKFKEFVDWLKYDQPIEEFEYPPKSITPGPKKLQLKNERGEIKVIFYSRIIPHRFENNNYVYFGDGIWGIMVQEKNKTYFIGGPSLNDKILNGFYSVNWYGFIEDF